MVTRLCPCLICLLGITSQVAWAEDDIVVELKPELRSEQLGHTLDMELAYADAGPHHWRWPAATEGGVLDVIAKDGKLSFGTAIQDASKPPAPRYPLPRRNPRLPDEDGADELATGSVNLTNIDGFEWKMKWVYGTSKARNSEWFQPENETILVGSHGTCRFVVCDRNCDGRYEAWVDGLWIIEPGMDARGPRYPTYASAPALRPVHVFGGKLYWTRFSGRTLRLVPMEGSAQVRLELQHPKDNPFPKPTSGELNLLHVDGLMEASLSGEKSVTLLPGTYVVTHAGLQLPPKVFGEKYTQASLYGPKFASRMVTITPGGNVITLSTPGPGQFDVPVAITEKGTLEFVQYTIRSEDGLDYNGHFFGFDVDDLASAHLAKGTSDQELIKLEYG